jgi:hypothetical protein
MSTETESPDLKRLKSGRDWNGYLTLENCEAVADRVRRLLEGHRYAWVRCFEEQRGSFPEVRQGLRMRDQGVTTHRSTLEDGGDFAGFNVSDTYGVWGAHTSVADQAGVRSLGYGHRSLTDSLRAQAPAFRPGIARALTRT